MKYQKVQNAVTACAELLILEGVQYSDCMQLYSCIQSLDWTPLYAAMHMWIGNMHAKAASQRLSETTSEKQKWMNTGKF